MNDDLESTGKNRRGLFDVLSRWLLSGSAENDGETAMSIVGVTAEI
jgi:hypothetical protein